jgi:DNA-binding PadR family transcriptional regulator
MRVEDGALYRALHRLEKDGFLQAEWRISNKNRKAKFYGLTASGQNELERTKQEWTRHTETIRKILGVAWETTR